jgi:hypothetical protein
MVVSREAGFTNHVLPAILPIVNVDFSGAKAPLLEKQSYFYVWSLAEVSEGLFYDLVFPRGKRL